MLSDSIAKYCGKAVQQDWIDRSINQVIIPSPTFCTHFVRNVWVNKRFFTRLIPGSFPRIYSALFPVNSYLYSLPTGLTISTTFLNMNSFNNKKEIGICV